MVSDIIMASITKPGKPGPSVTSEKTTGFETMHDKGIAPEDKQRTLIPDFERPLHAS
jgi:hypothetical protein